MEATNKRGPPAPALGSAAASAREPLQSRQAQAQGELQFVIAAAARG